MKGMYVVVFQLPSYPRKLFFFCKEEAAFGGETPILLSHIVYQKMEEKYPDFVEKLEEFGLIYTIFAEEEDDDSSALGRGWKSIFQTEDKIVAQQRYITNYLLLLTNSASFRIA